MIVYAIWRFIIEYFRADDRGSFIPGLSPSQFWSIIMVIGGVAIFFIYRHFDPKFVNQKEKADEEEQKTE